VCNGAWHGRQRAQNREAPLRTPDRSANPRFDTGWYLAHYPDVARSGMNPLVHFLRRGANEGRHARPSEIVLGEVTNPALSCRKSSPASS
jgi:hypothetical protein